MIVESFVHDSELPLGDVLPSQIVVPSSLSVHIWNRKLQDRSGSQRTVTTTQPQIIPNLDLSLMSPVADVPVTKQ